MGIRASTENGEQINETNKHTSEFHNRPLENHDNKKHSEPINFTKKDMKKRDEGYEIAESPSLIDPKMGDEMIAQIPTVFRWNGRYSEFFKTKKS